MMMSGMWIPFLDCAVTSAYDFRPKGSADGSIVNVAQFYLADQFRGSCLFKVVDVGSGGSISNVFVVVNASIAIPTSCYQSVSVAVFGDVNGTLRNVSITGSVTITGTTNATILSDFVGNTWPSFASQNVFSNLSFTLNAAV